MTGQVVLDTLGHVRKTIGQTTTPYKGGVLSGLVLDKTTAPRRANAHRVYKPAVAGPLFALCGGMQPFVQAATDIGRFVNDSCGEHLTPRHGVSPAQASGRPRCAR